MTEREPLKIKFPVQGWKQFLTSRKEMLDAYDQAREKAAGHEVETYHGKVAEAEFRKWLSSFLPKRYGVTSGYIISQGLSSTDKAPHFDIIIYDAMNSPVLWTEEDPDTSTAGRSMAIPAEYVICVLEIKSSFNKSTVTHAIEHLSDLDPLMGGPDEQNERTKMYLPANFSCGLVFYEMRKDAEFSEAAMVEILSGIRLRGFIGGLILRGEGHIKPVSGRIMVVQSETPINSTIGKTKESLLRGAPLSKSIKVKEGLHFGTLLIWAEPNFSQFAFDILAIIQGTYEPGRLSSWHGMGTTEADLRVKR